MYYLKNYKCFKYIIIISLLKLQSVIIFVLNIKLQVIYRLMFTAKTVNYKISLNYKIIIIINNFYNAHIIVYYTITNNWLLYIIINYKKSYRCKHYCNC